MTLAVRKDQATRQQEHQAAMLEMERENQLYVQHQIEKQKTERAWIKLTTEAWRARRMEGEMGVKACKAS